MVREVAKNPAFLKIARQYSANISLNTFERSREGTLISTAEKNIRKSIVYEEIEDESNKH